MGMARVSISTFERIGGREPGLGEELLAPWPFVGRLAVAGERA